MPLAPLAKLRQPVRAAQTAVSQTFTVGAPVGGLNFRDPINALPATDAIVADDVIMRPFGCELRPGWQTLAINLESSTEPIRTLMPYVGRTLAQSALFAVVGNQIVSVQGAAVPTLTVASASADGVWQYVNFQNAAGTFLIAVNDGGGYWTYDPSGGWVERTPSGSWPSGKRIVSVTAWKNRLWFVFADDPRGHYLPLASITGAAAAFDFGPQLRNGGTLAGIANWTLDAGAGIDDYQVIFGSEGDVLVYEGYDPASVTTYQLKGAWYIGRVPVGNRFWTKYQGDILALSEMGIVPISQLVNGQLAESGSSNPISYKVAPVLLPQLARTITSQGWALHTIAFLDVLLVQTPPDYEGYVQWAMNLTTNAWSRFTGVPMTCGCMWLSDFYFGGPNGAYVRGFKAGLNGSVTSLSDTSALVGDVQTSFQSAADGVNLMRFIQARPTFVAPSPPGVLVKMNPDYSTTPFVNLPPAAATTASLWDSATWDNGSWSGTSTTYSRWMGLSGTGRYGSLRVRMTGLPETAWSSAQVTIESGGPL